LRVDKNERLTVEQAMEHPFMAGQALTKHLVSSKTSLKKFNTRRRFKKAILAIQALNLMKQVRLAPATDAAATTVIAATAITTETAPAVSATD
jgi:hypothetical protein